MPTPLQTLIDEAAMYVKADLTLTGTVYDTDSAIIVNRLISGINDAKNKIAMKRYPLYESEIITLDANSCFETVNTTKSFYKLITASHDSGAVATSFHNSIIQCDAPPLSDVTVVYQYIPDDMLKLKKLMETDTDDVYCFPVLVDYRMLCFRAAQLYYEIQGGTSALRKAAVWREKWENALRNINMTTEDTGEVQDYYKLNFNSTSW